MSTIKIKNSPIVQSAPVTYLSADAAGAAGTLTVKNITGFAINQVLLIGQLGSEGSEIVKTHAVTAPTGTTITLAANTTFAHAAGDPIYLALYDQVEFSTATTAAGSKTVLATTSLWADSPTTEYIDTAGSTGYYFARFKNTISTTFSSYSDAMPIAGWASNTVGYMIDRALRDLEIQLSEKITPQDCYEWINAGLKLVQGKLKRWPEHYSYNTVLGQATRGTNIVTMPADIYDSETNKSLIAFRIGNGLNLRYLTPAEFDTFQGDLRVTQVTTQATAGQTTLAIDNSYDYEDSGSVSVYISGTKYTLPYTGVTRSATAGVLTGIPASGTGAITVTIPVDTYVWQNESEGLPEAFTVRNGAIEYWPLADSSEDNRNIYGDYSKVVTSVDSDGDTIDYLRYDMIADYLTWRMEQKDRSNNVLDMQSGWYSQFKEKLNDAIRTLPQNNKFPLRPVVNRMQKRGFRSSLQNIPIDQQ